MLMDVLYLPYPVERKHFNQSINQSKKCITRNSIRMMNLTLLTVYNMHMGIDKMKKLCLFAICKKSYLKVQGLV